MNHARKPLIESFVHQASFLQTIRRYRRSSESSTTRHRGLQLYGAIVLSITRLSKIVQLFNNVVMQRHVPDLREMLARGLFANCSRDVWRRLWWKVAWREMRNVAQFQMHTPWFVKSSRLQKRCLLSFCPPSTFQYKAANARKVFLPSCARHFLQ